MDYGERHDTRAALHRSRPPADQSDKRVRGKLNGEVARRGRHARHPRRSNLARMSLASGVSRRGRRDDATRKLLPWNLSLSTTSTAEVGVDFVRDDAVLPESVRPRCGRATRPATRRRTRSHPPPPPSSSSLSTQSPSTTHD